MKIFNFLAIALVAMLGFTACDKECEHDFVEVDYSKDIVGTWTALEPDHAAAYIFNADGTLSTTGFDGEAYWNDENGTYSVVNNKITMEFESGRVINGSFDIIPGKTISIVGEKGRHTYEYCTEDLSDEVIGMWVCTYVPWMEADMAVNVYQADGKALFTGFVGNADFDYAANVETTYKVIGDLMIQSNPMSYEGAPEYLAFRLDYNPNGSELGDVLTNTNLMGFGDQVIETTASMIRIKQNLDLANNSYDYSNIYVTNVKAKDAEFEFAGQTLNLATMDGSILDKMMKNLLFNVSFHSADEIVYNYHYNGENVPMPSPIVVDGNKMTIKKSANNPACKDIDVWTFQDQNNTQMHMYMPVKSFENFLANTAVEMLANEGKLDLNDAAAVKAIFDEVEAAIETINVSFIFKTAK